ncbi:MAG: DUF1844 domain-containing protein [Bdellovibrionota bacterium]
MSEDKEFKVTDKRGLEKEEKPAVHEAAPAVEKKSADEKVNQFPEVNFINLAASLGTSCMMHLGLLENPSTKAKELDLEMAQHEIDLLTMLETKTKGNLDQQEEGFLTQLLYELRMHFVETKKK